MLELTEMETPHVPLTDSTPSTNNSSYNTSSCTTNASLLGRTLEQPLISTPWPMFRSTTNQIDNYDEHSHPHHEKPSVLKSRLAQLFLFLFVGWLGVAAWRSQHNVVVVVDHPWRVDDQNEAKRCFTSNRDLKQAIRWHLEDIDLLAQIDPRHARRVQWEQERLVNLYGPNLETWCVQHVTDFSYLFHNVNPQGRALQQLQNLDLRQWETGQVVTIQSMFHDCHVFQGHGLEYWNTSSVTTLESAFESAADFDADLSGWDTRRVTNMRRTFQNTQSFRGQGLSQWNTQAVTDMSFLFNGATSFTFPDHDWSQWDVSSVHSMMAMFQNTKSFRGGRGMERWNVSSVDNFQHMFSGAVLFQHDLCAWGALSSKAAPYTDYMFRSTSCPLPDTPVVYHDIFPSSSNKNTMGPFCFDCRTGPDSGY